MSGCDGFECLDYPFGAQTRPKHDIFESRRFGEVNLMWPRSVCKWKFKSITGLIEKQNKSHHPACTRYRDIQGCQNTQLPTSPSTGGLLRQTTTT